MLLCAELQGQFFILIPHSWQFSGNRLVVVGQLFDFFVEFSVERLTSLDLVGGALFSQWELLCQALYLTFYLRTFECWILFLSFNQLGCDVTDIVVELLDSHVLIEERLEIRRIGSHSFDYFRLDLADLTSELNYFCLFCKFLHRLRYLFINFSARC